MSNYEASGPGGVGKRFGALEVGGVGGEIRSNDIEVDVVFQLTSGEDEGLNAQTLSLPAYAKVTKVFVVVDEAYAATSDATVKLDGTNVLTGVLDLATLGRAEGTLAASAADYTVGATPEDLTITVDAAGLASATGSAKVVVSYERV